ncbi:MAG: homocysteine S-methyltransferase family protein, partial [Candidatus Wallbacteria bacterium]|nr:homocysteine S-methyltransferase family protein [Candidatus Wallbacteria bacterium]
MTDLPLPVPAPSSGRLGEREIRGLLDERILVLDGGMGTALHPLSLTAGDFGGAEFEGCNEALNLTRPEVVLKIHEDYLAAGADIVETNSFGGTPLVLAEYQLAHRAYDINVAAARLARKACEKHSQPGRPRMVAGSLGPTTKTLSVTGGVSFDAMTDTYYEQARGLIDGGVDLVLIETCLDTLNAKAAARGVRRYFRESGVRLPVMLSCTIELMGTMLAGQGVEAYFTSMAHIEPLSVGMNCSTGPEFMAEHLRALSELAWTYVSCYPNAGLPDENGQFGETPLIFSEKIARFVEQGWLNIVGGCCGTHFGHIREVAALVAGKPPRRPQAKRKLALAGVEYFEPDETNRPVIVGERTNSLGSRKFKGLIAEGRYEEASEVGRKQVRGGAQVLDLCLQNPDRDEPKDMEEFLRYVVRKVQVPLMIDSTDAAVLELALKRSQGKAIVNSINLEDGEERFRKVCPLLVEYGAAVVVGCIDEDPKQGMAVTPERKVEIARRSYALLTGTYGVAGRDILFDPLV